MFKKITLSYFSIIFLVSFQNCFAQMFWNQACSFAGSNSSYISVRHSSSLNITGDFTIEAWVNPANSTSPAFQIILQKRNAGSDGYTLLLFNGKIAVRTNASTRLVGTQVLPNNVWTHVEAYYRASVNVFSIYYNGLLDTTAVVPGSTPISNTDSLWIGKGSNSPFSGMLDEIRIWNRTLQTGDHINFLKTSLGVNSGLYSGLVLSMTFQDNESSGSDFTIQDWSGENNFTFLRGASAVDLSNRPLQTIEINESVNLDGDNDYLTAPNDPDITPTNKLTLSAWIYPRSSTGIIIMKGPSAFATGTLYGLMLSAGRLTAVINGNFGFIGPDNVPLNRWSHVAFTYDGSIGSYRFYLNGASSFGDNPAGNIFTSGDSLFVGGTLDEVDFNGYIDEVRIIKDVQSPETINQYMFQSMEEGNIGAGSYAIYNLDGYATSGNSSGPRLYFRNEARFSYCGVLNSIPRSPMNRADALNFQSGFYLKNSNMRIPGSGNSGTIIDTLKILHNEVISDLNVFVATNHNSENDLDIFLISPNGAQVHLFNNHFNAGNADNMTTIFDDQADSSLVNSRYTSFSPRIKAYQNINLNFNGVSSAGFWKLQINDVNNSGTGDTGRLYGWGIQINNNSSKPRQMNVSNLIQGFYSSAANIMIPDTMKYYLRDVFNPVQIYDSSKTLLNASGLGQVIFANAPSGVLFYIQLKHRNSIETWSTGLSVSLNPLTFEGDYSFILPVTNAYGSNMIMVDTSPGIRFAIYGGDVNQDGIVDLSDITLIYNDAGIFASGYIATDVNGDNFADVSDLILTYNNSINFVSAITPLTFR